MTLDTARPRVSVTRSCRHSLKVPASTRVVLVCTIAVTRPDRGRTLAHLATTRDAAVGHDTLDGERELARLEKRPWGLPSSNADIFH